MAIYVRKEWQCQQTLLSFSEAEVTLLTIEKSQTSYVMVAVYRPQGKHMLIFLQELEQLLIQLDEHDNLILVGDFNIDISTPGKMGVSEYQTLISAYGLEHKIVAITREEVLGDKLTRSSIDHILTRIGDGQT